MHDEPNSPSQSGKEVQRSVTDQINVTMSEKMIEEVTKSMLRSLVTPFEVNEPTLNNIQNIPKMHVPQETIVALNVLAGNFQAYDEAMLGKLRRAGKEIKIIAFPRPMDTVFLETIGSGEKFDKMVSNICATVNGLNTPNTGVQSAVRSSNSIYFKVFTTAGGDTHMERLNQIEKLAHSIRDSETETKRLELLKQEIEAKARREATTAAYAGVVSEVATLTEIQAEIGKLLLRLRELSGDPTLTAALAIKKMEEQKKRNATFENMLTELEGGDES